MSWGWTLIFFSYLFVCWLWIFVESPSECTTPLLPWCPERVCFLWWFSFLFLIFCGSKLKKGNSKGCDLALAPFAPFYVLFPSRCLKYYSIVSAIIYTLFLLSCYDLFLIKDAPLKWIHSEVTSWTTALSDLPLLSVGVNDLWYAFWAPWCGLQ